MDNNKDASLSALVNSAITDAQGLFRDQLDLAKAELAESAKQAAAASAMFVVAGVLSFLAFIFALVAGAYGIVAAGLPVWAGFLIVTGVLVFVALILALVGRSHTKKVKGPERAVAQMEQTKAALSGIAGTQEVPGNEVAALADSTVASSST